jgi:hypothetical protein
MKLVVDSYLFDSIREAVAPIALIVLYTVFQCRNFLKLKPSRADWRSGLAGM